MFPMIAEGYSNACERTWGAGSFAEIPNGSPSSEMGGAILGVEVTMSTAGTRVESGEQVVIGLSSGEYVTEEERVVALGVTTLHVSSDVGCDGLTRCGYT